MSYKEKYIKYKYKNIQIISEINKIIYNIKNLSYNNIIVKNIIDDIIDIITNSEPNLAIK